MTLAFLAIAFVTVAAAAVAMALRNLIHSALLLVFNWAGIAAFYLWAGAEFVAFSQLMVYVGAVSMVVLFAVLLTQRSPQSFREQPDSISRVIGALLVGGAVLGVLFGAVLSSRLAPSAATATPTISVKELGNLLMGPHAAALLIVGVILTVTLIGAVIIASTDHAESGKDES
ncbi:MAG: NADH-quinone oxidoreductase subunit J [Verrucomicrobiota bacterium]|jgi:NADH:ubiquinone oxidoreductase subunit 6 (subunit J)